MSVLQELSWLDNPIEYPRGRWAVHFKDTTHVSLAGFKAQLSKEKLSFAEQLSVEGKVLEEGRPPTPLLPSPLPPQLLYRSAAPPKAGGCAPARRGANSRSPRGGQGARDSLTTSSGWTRRRARAGSTSLGWASRASRRRSSGTPPLLPV